MSPEATADQARAIREIRYALEKDADGLTYAETKRFLSDGEFAEFDAGCKWLSEQRVWGPLADRSEQLRRDAKERKVRTEGVVGV